MDLAQFTSHIQLFSSFLVALTGAVVAAGALIRPFGNWLKGIFSKEKEYKALAKSVEVLAENQTSEIAEQKLMKEAILCMLRDALTTIWHRAQEQGYICDWDRENFERMYAAYTALGGNSYIHEAHTQIIKLPSAPRKTRTTRKPSKKTTKKTTR